MSPYRNNEKPAPERRGRGHRWRIAGVCAAWLTLSVCDDMGLFVSAPMTESVLSLMASFVTAIAVVVSFEHGSKEGGL